MSCATRTDVQVWGCITAAVASRNGVGAVLFVVLAVLIIYLADKAEGDPNG